MKLMKNALVILAGGKGARIGGATPKQFKKYGQYNFIEYLLNNIQLNCFDLIVISCKKKYINKYLKNIKRNDLGYKIIWAEAGKNRQATAFLPSSTNRL